MGRICILFLLTVHFVCSRGKQVLAKIVWYFSVCYFSNLFCRLAKIKEWVDANDNGAVIIPLSGALESKVTINQTAVCYFPVLSSVRKDLQHTGFHSVKFST